LFGVLIEVYLSFLETDNMLMALYGKINLIENFHRDVADNIWHEMTRELEPERVCTLPDLQ
jgi:hypothetical protein